MSSNRLRLGVVLGTWLAIVVLPGALLAQGRGSGELSVLVTDDAGAPIPGAVVLLQQEGEPLLEPRRTGEDGRATFRELESGEWQVDVRREGFMIYTGYIKIEPGEGPEVGFSSRQRTGNFWAPLNVSFAGGGELADFAADEAERRRLEKEAERRRRREARAERRRERGDLARIVEPSTPPAETQAGDTVGGETEVEDAESRAEDAAQGSAVESEGREASSVEEAPEAPSAPQPERESEPAPAPRIEVTREAPVEKMVESEPESASPDPVEPEPTTPAPPVPEPTTPAPPVPEPVAPESGEVDRTTRDVGSERAVDRVGDRAPPGLVPNPRLLQAGPCRECRPGEWSVADLVEVTPVIARTAEPEATCPADLEGIMEQVADQIADSLPREHRVFAGSLRRDDGNDVLRLLPDSARQRIQGLLEEAEASASCRWAAILLPEGARFVGFRYRATDARRAADCPGIEECRIGDARWLDNPGLERRNFGTLVWAVIRNESAEQTRQGELRVYFEPAEGWLPPN